MTLNDLMTALKKNNTHINNQINKLADFINNDINNVLDNHNKNIKNIYGLLKTIYDDTEAHKNDTVIHVTQADKDKWNGILKTANDYAKQLFDNVNSFDIVKCTVLPTDPKDINTHTIYFLSSSKKENNNYYDEYMYINGQWELIGTTKIDLSGYIKATDAETKINAAKTDLQSKIDAAKTDLQSKIDSAKSGLQTNINKEKSDLESKINNCNKDLQTKIDAINNDLTSNYLPHIHDHDNKSVIDDLSDKDGKLLYKGNPISSDSFENYTEDDVKAFVDSIVNHQPVPNYITKDNKYILADGTEVFLANDTSLPFMLYRILNEYNNRLGITSSNSYYTKAEIDNKFNNITCTDNEINQAIKDTLTELNAS